MLGLPHTPGFHPWLPDGGRHLEGDGGGAGVPQRERGARRGQGRDCVTNLQKHLSILTTYMATPEHRHWMISSNTSGGRWRTPTLRGRLGGNLGGSGTRWKRNFSPYSFWYHEDAFNIKVILNKISWITFRWITHTYIIVSSDNILLLHCIQRHNLFNKPLL